MNRARLRRIAFWVAGALAIFVALGYCAVRPARNERPELRHALAAAAEQVGDGGTLDLASVTSFDWDKVHLLRPYSTLADLRAQLGFSWSHLSLAGEWLVGDGWSLSTDSVWLLVFVSAADEVTGWLAVNAGRDELDVLAMEWVEEFLVFGRDEARFRVRDVTSGYPQLEPRSAWRLSPDPPPRDK